jgi:hypothetical protein
MLSEKQQKEIEALRRQIVAAHKRLWSTTKVAKELGIAESSVRRHLKLVNGTSVSPPKTAGRPISDFRAAHDKGFIIPTRIREGLAKLGDGWVYEGEFCKLAGIGAQDLANHREPFVDHIVLVERTKRVWAGSKRTAAKLREMVP